MRDRSGVVFHRILLVAVASLLTLSTTGVSGCRPPASTTAAADLSPPALVADAGAAAAARRARLASVKSWVYQLQGDPQLDLEPLRAGKFDMVVIDYSADGSAEGEFSAEEIAALRASGKIVLAYLSIGEAEIARFYFDPEWVRPDPREADGGPFHLTRVAPKWLAEPNPDYPDNLKARYWNDEWRQIIVHNLGNHPIIANEPSYLDRIIDAGFDGVYLDIVDAFERFGPQALGGSGEQPDAASRMIDLVAAIARHARLSRGRPDFLIVPQNGATIVTDAAFPPETTPSGTTREAWLAERRATYLSAIDAIGAEDTFYFGPEDEDNPFEPQETTIALLDAYRTAGLPVFAIDYLTQDATIDEFYARCRAKGWTPYCSTRGLDELRVNPTQKP